MSIDIHSLLPSQTWQLRHKVMWPDKPIDHVKLPEDEQGRHYGLFVENQLISVISLFITGEEAQFRKFATETHHQGKGYGSKLLKHLIAKSKSSAVKRLWCNARLDKTNYYQRFGFKVTSKRFERAGIQYVIMERFL